MTDYYVETNGVDIAAGGTLAAPWRTIRYACTRVGAGSHRILVGTGTFVENLAMFPAIGVSIIGQGSSLTIIESSVNGYLITAESNTVVAGNQTFKDFKINGLLKTLNGGILSRGRSNQTFENLVFQDIDETGITVIAAWTPTKTVPPATYITNINILNCIFINCSKDESAYSRGALSIGGLSNSLISGITIEENAGYGVKQTTYGWYQDLTIQDCTITVPNDDTLWGADAAIELWNVYNNCKILNITANQWFSICLGNKGIGDYSILIDNCKIITTKNTGSNATIEIAVNDAIVSNNYLVNPSRYGIALWPNSADASSVVNLSNVKIHHNVIKGGGHSLNRFVHLAPSGSSATIQNIYIDNNTVYNCETGIGVSPPSPAGTTSNVYIRNNIFVGSTTVLSINHATCFNIFAQNNIFYNNTTIQNSGSSVTRTNDILLNPLLLLSEQEPFPYFEIASNSPAVDAGAIIAGITDGYFGSAPDVGAKEYIPIVNSIRSLILGATSNAVEFLFF